MRDKVTASNTAAQIYSIHIKPLEDALEWTAANCAYICNQPDVPCPYCSCAFSEGEHIDCYEITKDDWIKLALKRTTL